MRPESHPVQRNSLHLKIVDKAKAEVGVQVVERWILAALRNRTFFSLAVVSHIASWNPHGNLSVCSVDELPGMTKQSGKRSEPVPSPFS